MTERRWRLSVSDCEAAAWQHGRALHWALLRGLPLALRLSEGLGPTGADADEFMGSLDSLAGKQSEAVGVGSFSPANDLGHDSALVQDCGVVIDCNRRVDGPGLQCSGKAQPAFGLGAVVNAAGARQQS